MHLSPWTQRLVLAPLALLCCLSVARAQPAGPPEGSEGRRGLAKRALSAVSLFDLGPAPESEPELFELDYGHNIRLMGGEEYVAELSALLDRLATLPAGAELLEALGESGYATEISALPWHERLLSGPNARPLDMEAANYRVGPSGELIPGPGSGALIHINPDSVIPETTPEIVLGHELIHALHYHHGQRLEADQTEGSNAGTRLEELRTIGTDGYEDVEHSENELRGQWNELYPDSPVAPIRTSHGADFEHGESGCTHCSPPAEPESPAPPNSSLEDVAPPAPPRSGAAQALESLRGPR